MTSEAERLLAMGLGVSKLSERQLEEGAKGMPEKEVLAWWLSQRTTAARRWAGERRPMGDKSRVIQAIRRGKTARDRVLTRLKDRLVKADKDPVINQPAMINIQDSGLDPFPTSGVSKI